MNKQKNIILNRLNCFIGPQTGETGVNVAEKQTQTLGEDRSARAFLDGRLATSSDLLPHTQGQTPTHPRSPPHKAWLINSSTEAVTAPVKQGEVCVTVCTSQVFHPDIGHCLWPRVIGRVSRGVCGAHFIPYIVIQHVCLCLPDP